MVLYQKLPKNGILRGMKMRRFIQNQINLHQKVSQNHRTVIDSNKANIYEKPPTHKRATYAIKIFYHNSLNRIPRESAQNFYIMKFSITHWIMDPFFDAKKSGKKFSEFSLPLSGLMLRVYGQGLGSEVILLHSARL